MLAVTLGHMDSAVVLLQHEANVNTENTQGWSGNLLLSIYNKICIFDKFVVTVIREYI